MRLYKPTVRLGLNQKLSVAVLVSAFGVLGLPVVAQAAVTHKYEPGPSKVLTEGAPPSEPLPGPVAETEAMTVDSGHLWVAEKKGSENGSAHAVNEFEASSGKFMQQFPGVPGVGIAVGDQFHDVYVPDGGSVGVYSEAGVSVGTWTGANTPAESFEGGQGVKDVAVDNSKEPLTDPAAGDVYVTDESHEVVDVFKPETNGAEPAKANVSELTGTCPEASKTCEPAEETPFYKLSRVAVDSSTGDVFVADGTESGASVVDVFEPQSLGGYLFVRRLTGPHVGEPFGTILDLAVDSSNGESYVSERTENGFGAGVVDEFDEAGEFLGRITGAGTPSGNLVSPRAVAVDSEAPGDVFVADYRESGSPPEPSVIDALGADIVIPSVVTGPATGVTPFGATLNGTVELDGEGPATCDFVWGTSTAALGTTAACEPPQVTGEVSPVQASLAGKLAPDTTYYYRLQATNKYGILDPGEFPDAECEGQPSLDGCFTTPGPGIEEESVANVASTSATLDATISPHGKPTSYYFQYGASTEYGTSVPAPPGASIGSGSDGVEVPGEPLNGLTPSTVYHYRVVARSELSQGVFEEFPGPDQTFTTQGAALSGAAGLLDGREWEMVSPPNKDGALIQTIGEGQVTQAAANGDAMTYLTSSPTEAEPAGYANKVQVLSTRTSAGWSTTDLSSAHEQATTLSGGQEYRFFSPNLGSAVLNPIGTSFTPLSPQASEPTAYLRTDFANEDVNEPCPTPAQHEAHVTSCYLPLVTGKAGFANVPEGTKFGSGAACNKEKCGPEFLGATPDLSHVVLRSAAPLVEGMPANSLYEWAAGKLTPVSLLENEEPATNGPSLGLLDKVARNAVSSDGSRVVWSEHPGHLFLRDLVKGQTVQVDAVQAGASGLNSGRPEFQAASSDGSRVFFTDNQRLTVDSQAGANPSETDLYECVIVEEAGKLHCEVTDLTPSLGADVQHMVLGASEDGSYVYFAADGALAAGSERAHCEEFEVPAASCNIYVWHEGTISLVAVASANDFADWNGADNPYRLARVTSRVSGDGRWLEFMSQRGLTGYDTRDAVTNQPDEEVYVYDAAGGGVRCVSCDPSGARPVGVEYRALEESGVDGGIQTWEVGQGIAGSVPTWTTYAGGGQALYQSRYLSDNGRLFFNSEDALVPQDVNGVGDVYEWEPPGVGSCTPGSTGFSERSAGCVGLISSGTSSEESGFLDASEAGGRDGEGHEGGGDVFFLTAAKLSGQDYDDNFDVYDAHECIASSPCPPSAAAVAPPCDTGESCKAAPTPQPGIYGAPSSATFSGAGNVALVATPVVKRALTRAQKLAVALKVCKRERKQSRRAACEKSARQKYGAVKKAKKRR